MCLLGIGHPALGRRCGFREVRGSADRSVQSQPVSPECLRREGPHLWSQPGLVSHTALSAWTLTTALPRISVSLSAQWGVSASSCCCNKTSPDRVAYYTQQEHFLRQPGADQDSWSGPLLVWESPEGRARPTVTMPPSWIWRHRQC